MPIFSVLRSLAVLAVGVSGVALAGSGNAYAAEGEARASGYLRTGPRFDYPTVGHVGRGEDLEIYGCLNTRDWCDVAAGGERGWFPGRSIIVFGEGRRVLVTDPGALAFGIGILSFGMSDYWRDHYAGRPFYRDDRHWRRHGERPPWPRPDGRPRPGEPPNKGQFPNFGQAPGMPPHVGRPHRPPPQAQPHQPPRWQGQPPPSQVQKPPDVKRPPQFQRPPKPPEGAGAPHPPGPPKPPPPTGAKPAPKQPGFSQPGPCPDPARCR